MKISKFNLICFLIWGSVNLIALGAIRYQERQVLDEKGLDSDAVYNFEELSYPIQFPVYTTQVPFTARLLKPRVVERDQKYPLIVFLHGSGERGYDNVSQLRSLPQQMAQPDRQEKYPCYLLAPQCPKEMNWSSAIVAPNSPQDSRNLIDLIHQMISEISQKHAIDPRRIYITGFSMGGYGTWSMIAQYPDLFAAASPICGGGDPETVSKFVHLPLWVVHGDEDQVVPVSESRKMIEALRALGASPLYHELEGGKHNCWSQTYGQSNQLLDWLFDQKQ
ncbi:carboxylesterase family protein [Gimesia fumaroli]|uniref:Esterase n=1 Tax=Gimesia fumaroli TaxID=2527976 RepID=A0A518I5X4_9PLAN|nr:prolyl oligopeptidase family serine peptidase [Gimesia fumaroli]QDV48516.1 esterase [Gimesia fumaroli]